MKKTLDTTAIVNELSGQSVFFPTYNKRGGKQEDEKVTGVSARKIERKEAARQNTTPEERYRDTTVPRNHDTTVSRYHEVTTTR